MTALPPAHPAEGRCSDVLAHAAELLHADIALWGVDLRPHAATPPAPPVVRSSRLRSLVERARETGAATELSPHQGCGLAVPVLVDGRVAAIITAVPRAAVPEPQSGSSPAACREALEGPSRAAPAADLPREARPFLASLASLIATHSEDLAGVSPERRVTERHARARPSAAAEAGADSGVALDLMRRIAERMADPTDTKGALRFLLDEGRAALTADLGWLALGAKQTLLISRETALAERAPWLSTPAVRRAGEALAQALKDRPARAVHGSVADILEGSEAFPAPAQIAAVSLRSGTRRAGHLALVRPGGIPFCEADACMVESLAQQAALALRNDELYESLNQFVMATVKSLVSAVEAKDAYTSGHSLRVHVLAMLLAREMGLPRRQMEALKWSSLLHDVGKIGMPEAILNKRGRLTVEEYEIVKQHPQRGYEVLRHIPQLRDPAQAVLLHHERIDGQGYPLGVSGDAIPLAARIIAVADTFDALTTTRPYREARSEEAALEEMLSVVGRQLDREIVALLGKMIPFLQRNRLLVGLPSRVA